MPVIKRQQRVDPNTFVQDGTVRAIQDEKEPEPIETGNGTSGNLLTRPPKPATMHSSYRMREITHKRLSRLKNRTGIPIGELIDEAVKRLYESLKDSLPPEEEL
jgi:hypothetical protein